MKRQSSSQHSLRQDIIVAREICGWIEEIEGNYRPLINISFEALGGTHYFRHRRCFQGVLPENQLTAAARLSGVVWYFYRPWGVEEQGGDRREGRRIKDVGHFWDSAWAEQCFRREWFAAPDRLTRRFLRSIDSSPGSRGWSSDIGTSCLEPWSPSYGSACFSPSSR